MRDGSRPGRAVSGEKAPRLDAGLASQAWFRIYGVRFRFHRSGFRV